MAEQSTEHAAAAGSIGMTIEELLALPASVPMVTAGRAWGFGRRKAGELYRAGKFPVEVLPFGQSLRCRKVDLLASLGLALDGTPLAQQVRVEALPLDERLAG